MFVNDFRHIFLTLLMHKRFLLNVCFRHSPQIKRKMDVGHENRTPNYTPKKVKWHLLINGRTGYSNKLEALARKGVRYTRESNLL